ncbi:MAG: hypothetical protein KKD56_09660 [Acidobacteria bacterium]|nr:hypothetical protein [Acidobacteriota bacterium]MBU1473573.1 hypothetical protein [Acidobacteriota bacterium]
MRKLVTSPILMGMLVLCLFSAAPAGAQNDTYNNLLGEWDAETESGQYQFVFKFFMENDELKGTFEGSTGIVDMQKLSFEENTVRFTVDIDAGGQSMAIDFEANIDGDSLLGFLNMEFGEGAITCSKRK